MASAEPHCDTPDEQEEEKLKHKEVQMSSSAQSGVGVDVNAETGATVNAHLLSGNTFTGPVNIYNSAGNVKQKASEREPEKHTVEQGTTVMFPHTALTDSDRHQQTRSLGLVGSLCFPPFDSGWCWFSSTEHVQPS
ncbi:hypothetical protein DPX16_1513 [Anabarilius grahami]|uniref:Uncharacterized protein n=1 Tax=Anabarilius grahami TaxID=495550 RepID=A0A3N0YYW2_ANAGA|nr:hypothetical protein DPX16_1513 [Anabarilius grahami]